MPFQETKITGPVEVPVLLPTIVVVPEAIVRMEHHHLPEAAVPTEEVAP
jgi:hypothetical protein